MSQSPFGGCIKNKLIYIPITILNIPQSKLVTNFYSQNKKSKNLKFESFLVYIFFNFFLTCYKNPDLYVFTFKNMDFIYLGSSKYEFVPSFFEKVPPFPPQIFLSLSKLCVCVWRGVCVCVWRCQCVCVCACVFCVSMHMCVCVSQI